MGRVAARTLSSAVLVAMALASGSGLAQTSKLWGSHGELWSPESRLPDFSHAGYHSGEKAIADVPVVTNVLDFGAKADGATDDAAAIQAAIDATTSGAVLLPKGRYRVDSVLLVEKSGVVLRGEGAGPDGTVLVVERSLSDVFGPDPKWSYSGGFLHFRSPDAGTLVGAVGSAAKRGARELALPSGIGLAPGTLVELRQVDDGSGSLGRHLHAELASSGTCAYQVPLTFDWPVRIESLENGVARLRQPLRTDVRAEWSPELWTLPAISEVGVERLRIEFPDVPYAGHLQEPGYNAVFFQNGVVDSWVRDVTVVNADDAFLTEVRVKNVSFLDVRLEGRQGHHGFNLNQSADVLIRRLDVQNEWYHTITVDHRTNGTVVSNAVGSSPMSLDHHRDSPLENLYTELSSYGFQSGGSTCAGPQAGARNTYWNLRAPMSAPLLWSHMQTNVVGDLAEDATPSMTLDREWLEDLKAVDPPNLYDAQLARRLCGVPDDPCVRPTWDDATGSCGEEPRAEGASCDDGDPATVSDACRASVCSGRSPADEPSADGCGCRAGGEGPGKVGAAVWVTLALSFWLRRRAAPSLAPGARRS